MEKIVILLLVFVGSTFAQGLETATTDSLGHVIQGSVSARSQMVVPKASIWEIPYASNDNAISLSIQNNSNIEAESVSVTLSNLPTWLDFKSSTAFVKNISPNGSADAELTFSVDRKTPVGKGTTLTAEISTSDGQKWTKVITVSVGAPKDYKLYNNFPNPFNPSTRISFELPKASHVRLIIYDVVGREVAQVADGDYPAGYNELTWNGVQASSGVYFYRISTDRWSAIKKMLMLK